jgi:fructose-specific phosphotransferase system IIC component
MKVPQRFAVAVGFAIQTVVGAVCFVVVLLVAAAIAWFVTWLERWLAIPHWLSLGAQIVEKAIFVADVFVYGLLILSETLKFARTLWKEWKENG